MIASFFMNDTHSDSQCFEWYHYRTLYDFIASFNFTLIPLSSKFREVTK